MSRHLLSWWEPENAGANYSTGKPFNHTAGGNLHFADPGDVLWVCTTDKGRLLLFGRMIVDQVTDYKTARKKLRTDDVYEADHHVLARQKEIQPLLRTPIDLTGIADKLRFNSENDRLKISRGRVNGQQLRQIRALTNSTADMLQAIWDYERSLQNRPTPSLRRRT